MASLDGVKINVEVSATSLRRSVAAELRRIADEVEAGSPLDESAIEGRAGLKVRAADCGDIIRQEDA